MNPENKNRLRFNPASPTFNQDLYSIYRHLQQHQPLLRIGRTWVLTRFEDVSHSLKNPHLANGGIPQQLLSEFEREKLFLSPVLQTLLQEIVLFQEDKTHRAHRKAMMRLFIGEPYQQLKHIVQGESHQIVKMVQGYGAIDAIGQLAKLLWPRVFARWLQLDDEQERVVMREKQNIRMLLDPSVITPEGLKTLMASMRALDATFNDLCAAHLAGRKSPFFDALLLGYGQDHAELERSFSTDCITVLLGGSETSEALIGNLIHELAIDSSLQQQLRQQPSLIRLAVQETMRYQAPLQMTRRTVTAPLHLHGRTLKVQDSVLLCLGAANRDAEKFCQPDRFNLNRENAQQHLRFGFGVHQCMGQLLAHFQAESLCQSILGLLPPFTLDTPVHWQNQSLLLRALEKLPLRFNQPQ
jgi:cytochrome P450